MIEKTAFPTHNGNIFIIRTRTSSGIKCQVVLITMGCTMMRKIPMKGYISFYLSLSLKNMAVVDNGLCIIKILLFLPLPPALLGGPHPSPPKPISTPQPPATPRPLPRREVQGSDYKRRSAQPPPRRPTIFDLQEEDEEKENEPPEQREEEQPPTETLSENLSRLLRRWDQDIEHLKDLVSRDLDDFKRTLGIPH
ncbi:E4 protein [Human papillomavirus 88]|uniref:E4 protein n=1 Tax=Human papillomavirus 88 TaxID=337054 RepID=A8R8N4_9PAPI|nr:E4 protein [Human papillomavirus type 88]ABR20506.1 E4 protein [Human papillomavirus type 88]